MEAEQTIYYPAALQALSEADWAAIDAAIQKRPDPLFGGEVGDRYDALRQDIMCWKNEI
jgi:hypothetical protein